MALFDWIRGLLRRTERQSTGANHARGPITHVIILDGTMSSLDDGHETNAGLCYKLLQEVGGRANLSVYYEAGIQWHDWRGTWDVVVGRGINRQIRRAYGALASRFRPGDTIILMGYSRGAYAVRSLAGVIDQIGLLKAEHATVSNIRTAYRHYEAGATSSAAGVFRRTFCYETVEIEAVAVWDTVKALGLRLPLVWRFMNRRHSFHNDALGHSILNGFHALAYDERRLAYAPVMWACAPDWLGRMEQVWFRGTHGDIGGQLSGIETARPLSNIPLVWMLERIQMCGVTLPDDWRARFPQDVGAPSIGAWHGWAKLFLFRVPRKVGADKSESLHPSLQDVAPIPRATHPASS